MYTPITAKTIHIKLKVKREAATIENCSCNGNSKIAATSRKRSTIKLRLWVVSCLFTRHRLTSSALPVNFSTAEIIRRVSQAGISSSALPAGHETAQRLSERFGRDGFALPSRFAEFRWPSVIGLYLVHQP